ncbi:biotin/lipoyl-containing protein [Alistipes sp. ZOR0009]|jgi:biotin carboxyl carrier protein|uniref:biotin/lipoyl-containing protein n=1 Tax=Alistipes sp. ZOR0009 TaxID=1339253 RepID=UPI0006457F95|nr:biotin/lipoyl-containing protein [Alistipes sp. ZOR0009]
MSNAEEKKPEYIEFVVDDTVYETTVSKKYTNRKPWERPNPNLIVSFLPGTILELYVKEGDAIKAGEKMLLFEAMKMHTAINAPFNATVKSIKISVGDKVPKGELLIELE